MQVRAKRRENIFRIFFHVESLLINITWKFLSQWNKNMKPLLIKKHLLLCFLQDQWKLMKYPLRYFTELTSFSWICLKCPRNLKDLHS